MLAANALGPAGYGRYAIVLGLLVTLTALQAGLRDSAIVLEHHDRGLHGSVVATQYLALLAAMTVAFTVGAAFDLTSVAGAVLLAAMIGTWALEEAGRRFLMRDQRFGALVVNDLAYAAAALGTVALLWTLDDPLQLTSFLWAMTAGSVAAFGLAIVQLPKRSFSLGGTSIAGMRQVLGFAVWRSAQMVVRPLSLTLTRVAIAGFTSAAALGRVEAARLLIAPAQVLISGFGPFLLTQVLRRPAGDRASVTRTLVPPTVFLVAMTMTVGAVAIALAGWLQPLLVGDEYPVDRVAILGWSLLAVGGAANFPAATLATARRQAFPLFVVRAFDAAVGIGTAVVLVNALGPRAAPYGLALGTVVSVVLLWRRAYRPATGEVISPELPASPPSTP